MIKNIKNIYLVGLLFVACSSQTYNEGAVIKGLLSNGQNLKLSLEQLTSTQIIPVDSTISNGEGNFSFNYSPKEAGFYRISQSKTNYVNFIWTPGEKIMLKADAQNIAGTHIIEGSKETALLTGFNKGVGAMYLKNDSINKVLQMAQSMGNYQAMAQAQAEQQNLNAMHANYVKDFVSANPSSIASLAAVQKLSLEEDFDYFLKVEEGLKKVIPNSILLKDFSAVLAQNKKLNVGSEAPEILLNTPEGKSLALSSLRGKVVLIDFWASWCRPCRAENPNVVKMYAKYKDKGFEILGVSLDNTKQAWVNAIAQDQLTWNHVSDLKGWQSAVAPLYKVNSIPMTFLIDKEGKIIGKNLRGPALEQKLEELFK